LRIKEKHRVFLKELGQGKKKRENVENPNLLFSEGT